MGTECAGSTRGAGPRNARAVHVEQAHVIRSDVN